MKKYHVYLVFTLLLASNACKVSMKVSDSKPVSHVLWSELLQDHVSKDGWVDYKGFQKDSLKLKEYLNLLSSGHPNDKNWSRDEQLAYWINAYNAYTVKLITDHYPVQSIKDIKNGIPFVNTVWDIKFINIEGHTYDLNNIEHGIIRPYFNEPRIHFAINCASVSCPRLLNEAYTADQLEEQLTNAARSFLADPLRNQVEKHRVSSIFSWFRGDFKKKSGSLVKFINQYAPEVVQEDTDLAFLDYNWQLNEEKNKP
ncbi:MAG: DUF547 domain-containing protein [Saprospiraceae bacterium]|nr:DUF547 domain-containing protein [Saprospiraceae bacterium]